MSRIGGYQEPITPSGQGYPPSDRAAVAIRELIKGRELATKLEALLKEPSRGDPAGLIEGILGSFSRVLSVLDSGEGQGLGQDPASGTAGSPCSEDPSSGASHGKRKVGAVGARRGGWRRRAQPSSWRRVTAKTLDDGQTWRKYGQKAIQSAKFPRSYFRCTHKHDQGCKAIRQVQQSEADPSTYIITYMGEHTCRDPTKIPHIITTSKPGESFLISFESAGNHSINRQVETQQPSSYPSSYRPDGDEEVLSNLTADSSSSDYLVLPPVAIEGSTGAKQIVGSTSDHGDVTSGFQYSSSSSLEMGFMADPLEFEEMFGFDHDDHFF